VERSLDVKMDDKTREFMQLIQWCLKWKKGNVNWCMNQWVSIFITLARFEDLTAVFLSI
jgi:hypothetical protein